MSLTIVKVRDRQTNYLLTASRNRDGDLVLSGSDMSEWVKDMFSTDEYEYFYRVKASDVARVCAALGTCELVLLWRIRRLLAGHKLQASEAWKVWLNAHGIPYEFTVWR